MSRRFGLWLCPVMFLLGVSIPYLYQAEKRALNRARGHLVEGRFSDATEGFQNLLGSPWNSDQARAGSAIASLLSLADLPFDSIQFDPVVLEAFPVRLLLHRAIQEARYEGCLRLSEFLLEKTGDPSFDIFRSAALLELGKEAESSRIWQAKPPEARYRWIRQRLEEVSPLARSGHGLILYDREGRLLGGVNGSGRLKLLDGVNAALIPDAALKQICGRGQWKGIRLSIDLNLSQLAMQALSRYRGSIVLLSPRTGEVLAAVSDPRTLKREGGTPALEQRREPASIVKLITTAAGLRAGLDVEREIARMRCRGAKRYAGSILWCSYRAGRLRSLDRAMAVSCNIAFANLGMLTGKHRMTKELRRFGFDKPSHAGIEFGRMTGKLTSQRDLADLSIGLEMLDVTPLHAALVAAVFANHGVMPEPRLFHSEVGVLGLSSQTELVDNANPVSDPRWMSAVTDAMQAVVGYEGTASGIVPRGLEVLMKTGTGKDGRLGYHTNYVGFCPQLDVAFCVRVTGQRTSARVRYATRRVTGRLLRELAAINSISDWNSLRAAD